LEDLFADIPRDSSGNAPVLDGIVNLEKYKVAQYRVLWILKEPNDTKDGGGWDLRNFLSDGLFKDYSRWKTTFSLPLRVMHGLFNNFSSWESLPNVDKIDELILESIAYINLKKIPGGSRANGHMVSDAYKKSKTLILQQVEVFRPHIVICCGCNMWLLRPDLGIPNEGIMRDVQYADYTKHNSIVFIDTYHPAQTTINAPTHYRAVMNACEKGLNLP